MHGTVEPTEYHGNREITTEKQQQEKRERGRELKAGVGSSCLVSSGKKSIITFQYIVVQAVRKNTTLLHLSLALCSGFRKWRLVISEMKWQCFLATSDVPTSCLAVRTSEVPWVPQVAGDTVSQLESDLSWDGLVYSAATFPASVSSCRESLV